SCAAVRVRPPTSTPATLVPLGTLSEKNHCAPVYRPPRTSTPTPVHSRPRTQPRRGASSSKPSNGDSWRDSSGGTGPNVPGGSATEPTTGEDAAAGCAGAPCAGSAGVAADAGVAVVGASVAGVGRIDVRTTGSGRVHGATGGITCVASEAPCSPAGGSAGDDPAGPDADPAGPDADPADVGVAGAAGWSCGGTTGTTAVRSPAAEAGSAGSAGPDDVAGADGSPPGGGTS